MQHREPSSTPADFSPLRLPISHVLPTPNLQALSLEPLARPYSRNSAQLLLGGAVVGLYGLGKYTVLGYYVLNKDVFPIAQHTCCRRAPPIIFLFFSTVYEVHGFCKDSRATSYRSASRITGTSLPNMDGQYWG